MLLEQQLPTHYFTDFHLFCGSGGGALGFQQAETEFKGIVGKFTTLGGIDCDSDCIRDFKKLTGVDATQLDLFDRQQYIDFWGHEPPPSWREATPEDVYKAAQCKCPDVVFLSPPCKGFSGLLPEKSSKSPKYQALNRLVFRSMQLTVEAFKDNLPAAILIENVPRIRTRGAKLIENVKKLLGMYGYVFSDGTHDCGEIGGLGQTRTRYLLIARNPQKLKSFIYQPRHYQLKSIGEVLGSVPLPGDMQRAGAMHRIPNLQWKTWVRLALIPAGKDWRALNERDTYANLYQIVPWDKHSTTVTGAYGTSNGAISVADPRLDTVSGYGNKYRVTDEDTPAPTITGSRIGSGAILYADNKLDYIPRAGTFRVVKWSEPSPTMTGSTGAGRSNGVSAVSDPRLAERDQRYPGTYKITPWDKPSTTIIGQTDIQAGALSVSDPRLDYTAYNRALKVTDWEKPSGSVTSGDGYVADPTLGCAPRSGVYEVQDWNQPSKTVFASMDVHSGTAAVADPRIPTENESGVWVIISDDGTWHRPITTYEMAMLQGLPATYPDGSPLILAGKSDKEWREHIGNMVPPPAACAMATSMLETMLPNIIFNEWAWNYDGNPVWVRPKNTHKEMFFSCD